MAVLHCKMRGKEDNDVERPSTIRKRKAYSIVFKKEVLTWIEEDESRTAYQAAQHFPNITQSTIRGWILSKEEIESFSLNKKTKRVPGAGRKPLLLEHEDIIADVIRYERQEKKRVRRSDVMKWAIGIAREHGIHDFKASAKWLDGFLKRNDLALRRRTNLTVLSNDFLIERAFSFLKYLTAKVTADSDMSKIVLMDETAVYMEDPRTTTIDEHGARHVVIRSTGFASKRITCVLAVKANGDKIPPVIIQKKKNGDNAIVRKDGVFIAYNEKGWVNQR